MTLFPYTTLFRSRQRSIADDLVTHGKQGRHDNRGPPGTAQRREIAITLTKPLQGVHLLPASPIQ